MTRPFSRSCRHVLFVCALVGLLGACSRSSPLEEIVSGKDPSTFAIWRSRLTDDLSTEECKEFDFAVQEIKISITEAHVATGVEAVEAAMLRQVNGQTVRHVLQAGTRDRLARLKADRRMLEEFIKSNSEVQVGSDDYDGKARKRDLLEDQTRRLKAMVEEINRLTLRMNQLQLGLRLQQV